MTSRTTVARLFALFVTLASSRRAAADPPSAQAIVASSDAVRNPKQAFRLSLALVEYQNGHARDTVTLAVHTKLDPKTNQFRNLVRYKSPARDVGKLVLLSGNAMWFYDPSSKASVRISAQQRLIGQASDGDVMSVNLAHDYTARTAGEERIEDADHQMRATWHIELAAATPDAAYARLEAWIEKETFRPVKTKFFSDSGRLLKVAYYRKFELELGVMRPAETIIVDAVDSHLVTKVTSSEFRDEQAEDAWFQRDYLPRFSEE